MPRRRSALGSHCFNGRVGAADPRPDQRWRPLGRGAIIQAEASLVAKAIAPVRGVLKVEAIVRNKQATGGA